jgi:arsenate reductase (glutaredoxin)
MTVTLHGIPNCDTMKKARLWLDEHGVGYRFHDYKRDGLDEATLAGWIAKVGWEVLLNRAGTTFRKLPEGERTGLDAARAAALMLAQPAMVKRPVLVAPGTLLIGFSADRYAAALL